MAPKQPLEPSASNTLAPVGTVRTVGSNTGPPGPVGSSSLGTLRATPRGGNEMRPMPVYHKGTDNVSETGPAVLKKGEAVLSPSDAAEFRKAKRKGMAKHTVMERAADALGSHKEEEKPKKEIKHIVTKKAKSGGYIHTHVHTHPEHHPDEDHVSKDQDEMADHMLQHMGEANPGEAEADGGSSGVPNEAAPAAGASAGGPSAGAAAAPPPTGPAGM